MRLIVGLGNPGREYARTRHNAGFMALDRLAARHAPGAIPRSRFNGLAVETRLRRPGSPDEEKALLLKPTTYMNRSGQSVAQAIGYYKLDPAEDLLVLVDDSAIPLGSIRVRGKGSDGGHNGLADIARALGSTGYARCRIGIGERGRLEQKDHVLGRLAEDEQALIDPALDRTADAAETWALEGLDACMNRFNVRPEAERPRTDDKKTEPDTGQAPAAAPDS